jgi:proteasome lid subunit RPN8/RPN11
MVRSEELDGVIVLVERTQERVLVDVAAAAWTELRSEWGGLLFGRTYRCNGLHVVWVKAAVPGLGSGTPVSFEIESESYVLARRLLGRCRQGVALDEVGLWHSHPGLTARPSSTDVEYHQLVFPALFSVSIIVDPYSPDAGAYVNFGNKVVRVPAYAIGAAPSDAVSPWLIRPWDNAEVGRALS